MRLLLSVVVVVVLIGVNYIANINQELIVRSRLEISRSKNQFSESFIRQVASIDRLKRKTPSGALNIPNSILQKKFKAHSLIQKDGVKYELNLNVTLNKVSDKLVEISGDKNLTFFMKESFTGEMPFSLVSLNTGETIVLKSLPNIAKKNLEKTVVSQAVSLKSSGQKRSRKGLRATNGEFELYQAIVPRFSKSPLRGRMVSGRISVIDGSVEEFDVYLSNTSGDEKTLSFNYSEIRDGGIFSYDDQGREAFGILTNDGEKGVRVRFSTGSMAGAIVSFSNDIENKRNQLPQERVINLREKARSDFKQRALSNQTVKESSVNF